MERGEESLLNYLGLIESKSPRNWIDTVKCSEIFQNLGWLYYEMMKPGLAVENYRKGVVLLKQLGDKISARRDLAPALSNFGYFASRVGLIEEAKESCLEAYEYFKNPSNKWEAWNCFINLTHILSNKVELQEDLQEHIELGIDLASQWGFNPDLMLGYERTMHMRRGDFREALSTCQEIRRLNTKANSKMSRNVSMQGDLAISTGFCFARLGEYDSAFFYTQKAIQLFSHDFNESNIWVNPAPTDSFMGTYMLRALREKAAICIDVAYHWTGDTTYLRLGYETFSVAFEVLKTLRLNNRSNVSKRFLSLEGGSTLTGYIATCVLMFEETGDLRYLKKAFYLSERIRNYSLEETRREALAKGYGRIPADLIKYEQGLQREISRSTERIGEEKAKGINVDTIRLAGLMGKSFDLKRELEKWKQEVGKQYPEFFEFWTPKDSLSIHQVQEYLGEEGEVFLQYVFGRRSIYGFYISVSGLNAYQAPLPPNFDTLISEFTQSLSDYRFIHDSVSQSYTQYTNSAHELYKLLLEPVLKDLPTRTKLIVVPDGPLSQIPFEALLTEQPAAGPPNYAALPYLLKEHSVRYAYSAALLLETQNRPAYAAKGGCLALAPSYKGASASPTRGNLAVLRDGHAPLEGAQLEVQALSELGMPGEFLMGAAATEETFKALAPSYNLLHLALHGQADPEEQLNSSIRFAATPGDTCQDDLLHAYEMYAVPLKADLVVLSACESGVGEYLEGEGVMSLARHFMAAGASSVVMTQWQVEDQASAELMRFFYQNLKDGMRSANALHQAKLSFLQNADSRTAHPFYWAGYIANGASKRVPLPKGWAGFGLVMASLAFGLSIFGVAQWRNRRAA